MEQIHYRKATIKDTGEIFRLYKAVSKKPGTLAREESEITKNYVESFTLRALKNSAQFVAVDVSQGFRVVGEVHCYKLEPKAFNHILSDLTIAINPDYQGKGIGRRLFETLLSNIASSRADILRVELIVRESNERPSNYMKSLVLSGKAGWKSVSVLLHSNWRRIYPWHGLTPNTAGMTETKS